MKAQASIEFMTFISVLLLIFIVFIWNSFSLQKDMIKIESNTEAKRLSDKIAFEINTAVKSGNGYGRNFFIENSFAGISNFQIFVDNYIATVQWSGGLVNSQILTKNITGTVNKGWNFIENKNGYIYVS